MRKGILAVAVVAAVALAALATLALPARTGSLEHARAGAGGAAPDAMGHRPGHIGCMNHNHGPAWHDGHARALAHLRRSALERAAAD